MEGSDLPFGPSIVDTHGLLLKQEGYAAMHSLVTKKAGIDKERHGLWHCALSD